MAAANVRLLCAFRSSWRMRFSSSNAAAAVNGTSAPADSAGTSPWFLSAAVAVERIPTLVPELTEFQTKMMHHLRQVETENSLKSDHELRHEDDRERTRKRQEGDEGLQVGVRTAEDDEDDWEKELNAFVPFPKTTPDDHSENVHSSNRLLDRSLHLVVRRKLGEGLHWDLPTAINEGEETLRQTAEKAVTTHCGNNFGVQVLGNAPWAFYKYKYSKKISEKTGRKGEKVFIFKGVYHTGSVKPNSSVCEDFKWVLRDELWESLDEKTRRALFEVLYDED